MPGRPEAGVGARGIVGPLFMLAGGLLLIVAGSIGWQQHSIRAEAVHATGRVVSIIERHTSRGRVSGVPMVRYTDQTGTLRDFTPPSSTSLAKYKVGDTVSVIYPRLNPDAAKIDDWLTRWARTVIYAALAVACLSIAALLRRG